MNDIEIALEDLDTLVEIARQHTGIASWLGLVQSALIMKEALEKQIAQEAVNKCSTFTIAECPHCNGTVNFSNKHCHWCGQKLDWSEVEDE